MKLTKKNIFVLLSVCFLALVVAFSFQHVFNSSKDLATDSGFDSDFGDSGGSSSDYGGSSYDSDYDGSSYDRRKGSGSTLNTPEDYLIFLITLIVSACVIYPIVLLIASESIEKKYRMAGSDDHLFEENFHDPSIVKEAYDIYVKIQEAWSKNNIETVRNLLSSEMYNMYNSQIKTMLIKKQRNAMSDFKFVKGVINDHKIVDGQDRYVVILRVYCKDYMVSDVTNKVIRGNSRRTNDYIYSLTFVRNKSVDVDKCPNCDAELPPTGLNVKCPYCGSIIERKAANLVLVEKKLLRQR